MEFGKQRFDSETDAGGTDLFIYVFIYFTYLFISFFCLVNVMLVS